MVILASFGCAHRSQNQQMTDTDTAIPIKEHLVLSVLWQQNAAEYKALCYQAFNQARYALDIHLKTQSGDKPLAIITDIDETILDNSPYSSQMITRDENYNRTTWVEWGKKESAELVPGAAEFLAYAASKGVTIFYISNRLDVQLQETVNNLKAYDLPDSRAENVILRTTESGKEARRQQVYQTHDVVLYLGDNLSDFHEDYDDRSSSERNRIANAMQNDFGVKYIVLPNPMYGDWETKGLYDGNYSLTESEKRAIRKKKLKMP